MPKGGDQKAYVAYVFLTAALRFSILTGFAHDFAEFFKDFCEKAGQDKN